VIDRAAVVTLVRRFFGRWGGVDFLGSVSVDCLASAIGVNWVKVRPLKRSVLVGRAVVTLQRRFVWRWAGVGTVSFVPVTYFVSPAGGNRFVVRGLERSALVGPIGLVTLVRRFLGRWACGYIRVFVAIDRLAELAACVHTVV
jgi:hypothetical protein